jgi:putative oxidoreductase
MKINTLRSLIAALLILLYVYTATSKLLSFADFQMQMRMQVLPEWLKGLLTWTLPPVELTVAALLFVPSTRQTGLWLSAILLMAFTLYIGLVLLSVFDRVPCSCGGVLRSMGWSLHFGFNLFFLLSNTFAIGLTVRERRIAGS